MSVNELRQSEMMAHLWDALSKGQDIGPPGRLVFVMVARHFLSEAELLELLRRNSEPEHRFNTHQIWVLSESPAWAQSGGQVTNAVMFQTFPANALIFRAAYY